MKEKFSNPSLELINLDNVIVMESSLFPISGTSYDELFYDEEGNLK